MLWTVPGDWLEAGSCLVPESPCSVFMSLALLSFLVFQTPLRVVLDLTSLLIIPILRVRFVVTVVHSAQLERLNDPQVK
jgi:hypothetical protein